MNVEATAPGRALVTGAAGFIGSHLVRSLLADNWQVTAVVRNDRVPPRRLSHLNGVDLTVAELEDRDTTTRAVAAAAPDVIYHLAADTSVRHFDGTWELLDRAIAANFTTTLNILFAAQAVGGVRSIVRTGGLEEYGGGAVPSLEDQREDPVSPYSAGQAAATHWCQMLQPNLPFAIVTLRPALVYGPDQSNAFLVPALIETLREGERFLLRAADRHRDYVFVADVVAGLRAAADRSARLRGSIINIASGHDVQMNEVASLIAAMMNKSHLLDLADGPEERGLKTVLGDNALAAELLGWRPTTSLADGLAATIAWYDDQRPLREGQASADRAS